MVTLDIEFHEDKSPCVSTVWSHPINQRLYQQACNLEVLGMINLCAEFPAIGLYVMCP